MSFKTASLTPTLRFILREKGTEPPSTETSQLSSKPGTYLCRQCGHGLFRTNMQFASHCGWPSFDQEIAGAVSRVPDKDGRRTEIVCTRCGGHLGHVFEGEGFTARNLRHCVNTLSLEFVEHTHIINTEEAIFAGGCFWGVDYYFKRLNGVLKTEVGYTGGHVADPSYNAVCTGHTQHVEAIRVVYDPSVISYRQVAQYFFEIHDPTQQNGQGPDIGSQYLSAVFYYDETQHRAAEALIQQLSKKYGTIATRLLPVSVFWPAETYHQDYYGKNHQTPYCHRYVKRL